MTRATTLAAAPLLLAAGCQVVLESPTPEVVTVDPTPVCNDQLVTTVTLQGNFLSPVVVDGLTDEPSVLLPRLTLRRVSDPMGEAAGDPPVELDAERTHWRSQSSMEFDIYPELALAPGAYDVTATNADGQSDVLTASLGVVDPPSLSAVDQPVACLEQEGRDITLTGSRLLWLNDGSRPQALIGSRVFGVTALDGCEDAPAVDGQLCTEATFNVPAGGAPAGLHDVTLINPEPASCAAVEPDAMEVLPAPAIEAITPRVLCPDLAVQTIVLSGSGFAEIDGVPPAVEVGGLPVAAGVALGGECDELSTVDGRVCRELSFEVDPTLLVTGENDVVVTNPAPAGCSTSGACDYLYLVEPPVVTQVLPDTCCIDEQDVTLTIQGSGFLEIDGELPSVAVGPNIYTDVPLTGGIFEPDSTCMPGVRLGQEMQVTLGAGSLIPGVHELNVTNPTPASCDSEPLDVEVLGAPELTAIAPDLACLDQGPVDVAILGANLLELYGFGPDVTIDDGVTSFTTEVALAGSCAATGGPAGTVACDEIAFQLPQGALPPGLYDVDVTNPAPADCTNDVAQTLEIQIVAAPEVDEIDPPVTCTEAPETTFAVRGGGMLRRGVDCGAPSACPTVEVGGLSVEVEGMSGCSVAIQVPGGGELCDALTFRIPAGGLPTAGEYPVTVTNPETAPCTSDGTATLRVDPPPEVDPLTICDDDTAFDVFGAHFDPGAEVSVDGAPVSITQFVGEEQLGAALIDPLQPGTYDLGVRNPDGCDVSLPGGLEVLGGPSMYFVDPPVIFSDITTVISIYVGDISGTITDVWLEGSTGDLYTVTSFSYDGSSTILAEVEADGWGLVEGAYTVHAADDTGCDTGLVSSVVVEEDLDLALDRIEPSFGWGQATTAVDIYAVAAGDLLPGEVQFADVPRVYLNPTSGDAATTLTSVQLVDAERITATVPDGLPAGTYDVIVVNPEPGHEIGLLLEAFEVTTDAPPVIDSVSPARVYTSSDTPIVIQGEGFELSGGTVSAICRDTGGNEETRPVTIDAWSATTIDGTMSSSHLTEGTICIVRVTNTDGAFAEYSAISVGSSSGNLFGWSAGFPLVEPRRAPAVVAGRSTDRARSLYAIGGDDGDAAGALASIERCDIDPYGAMGPWEVLPDDLPEPRTLAGAAVAGRFVFLVGGNDGAGPVDTVWRAQVLDPLAAPRLVSLSMEYGDGAGLGVGTWIYRISALFDAADPIDPGGESLPGDPVVATLPDVPDLIRLTLTWEEVDGAVAYAVYRTPTAGAGSGSEQLLAVVPDDGDPGTTTASFTDVGDAVIGGDPRPDGALGAWAEVATLPGTDEVDAAREGPAVAVLADPQDDGVSYLVVAGGRDGYGDPRDEVNLLMLDDDGETVAGWVGASTLAEARHECAAFVVDDTFHTVVGPGEVWLYVGGGRTAAGVTDRVEGAELSAGGTLVWDGTDWGSRDRSGYAVLSANNTLYIMGGRRSNGSVRQDGYEAEITGPPGLAGWSNLGSSILTEPRELPGSASESATWFVVGGADEAGDPLATVDYTSF